METLQLLKLAKGVHSTQNLAFRVYIPEIIINVEALKIVNEVKRENNVGAIYVYWR